MQSVLITKVSPPTSAGGSLMGHENVLNDNSIQQQNIIGYERG